jgi:hypothetical protein
MNNTHNSFNAHIDSIEACIKAETYIYNRDKELSLIPLLGLWTHAKRDLTRET